MTQRGELFEEGPQACPFIALELDRDRRSDKPDDRHRCFAEPTPQPRAIAHQERYCLSPDFAPCPIFQGWAMRAAARPLPVAQPMAASAPLASGQSALPFDVPPVVPPPGEAWPADAFASEPDPDAPDQMAAFEVEPEPELDNAGASTNPSEPAADASDDPPVPDFLAGRPERPVSQRPRASQPEVPYPEKVSREDLVPSWDLTDRYGADSAPRAGRASRGDGDGGGGGDRNGGLVTAVAVIAILALGVLGVILLPGMLAGHGPAPTPTPALTILPTGLVTPSLPPFATDTRLGTALPTAEVTLTPSPEATPRLYSIKSSDNSLTQIAHRFGLTLRELLDANPQITNPDRIRVGQMIIIPDPTPTPAPAST